MSTTALDRPPQQPPAGLAAVGWSPGRQLPYDEWLRQGSRLGLAGRNAAWWIGDWLQYGTARYGTKYSAAARVTGYDRQTLMNMVYVAGRFEFSRRREDLSWSHHAELASLEAEQQERWLDHAERERLSVRDLREELATKVPGRRRRGRPRGRWADEHGAVALSHEDRAAKSSTARSRGARSVVCPNCGCHFEP
jgi:hypothetical protein